ncbi:MAG: putative NAD/FAD-dependent oxidoreductase [Lentimonas sp.]|jgi:predicted NAD/FAD-dependent oxidoreductase
MNKRIAIIGSGMSGVTLAKKLSTSNEVVVFDKSRGIGGRMATRRIDENYHFDHGAQFFTAKDDEFKDFCIKAKADGVIEEWKCRFAEIVDNKINRKWQFGSDKPHYVAKPQMNNLCKYVAHGLEVLLGKKIESINFDSGKWSLRTANDEIFDDFDYLFLAIPSHQAINLIPKSFKYFDVVSNVKMMGCFALMLGFKEDLRLDFDAALVKESIISWISVNSSKPERPSGFSLLLNSSNGWADENIEEDSELVKQKMIDALQKIVNFNAGDITYQNVHRWRYANSSLRQGHKSLFDPNLNLGICGDWLISGRVENAFLSAMDLHEKYKTVICQMEK